MRLWVDLNDVDFWPKAEAVYHARRIGHSYYTMTLAISSAHFLARIGGDSILEAQLVHLEPPTPRNHVPNNANIAKSVSPYARLLVNRFLVSL